MVSLVVAWFSRSNLGMILVGGCLLHGPSTRADDVGLYERDLKPLLKNRCYPCHGALKQEANLRLDTVSNMRAGGISGPAITPGSETQSRLWQRIQAEAIEERMPPEHEGEPFTAAQQATLRAWLLAGAPEPENEVPEPGPKEHWSFQPIPGSDRPVGSGAPDDPSPMSVESSNAIDAILAMQQRQAGIASLAEAPREVLIRRLYVDLAGYLPSHQEIEAACNDGSLQWYENLVERLLSSPSYGERWGRHWMDVWRYSDWWGLGEQARNSHKHLWHWRDWMIDSLNNDLPYDEMVRQMLAADELYPDDLAKLRATGFLARNYFLFNRHQWMDETVEHVGKAFLGMTLNCAKCHDHKYDPISQQEYFAFRAIFEPYAVRVDMLPGEIDTNKNGIPVAFDADPTAPTYLHIRGEETRPDKTRSLPAGVPAIFSGIPFDVQPVPLPPTASKPELRKWVQENYRQAALREWEAAKAALQASQIASKGVTASDVSRGLLEGLMQANEIAALKSAVAQIGQASAENQAWITLALALAVNEATVKKTELRWRWLEQTSESAVETSSSPAAKLPSLAWRMQQAAAEETLALARQKLFASQERPDATYQTVWDAFQALQKANATSEEPSATTSAQTASSPGTFWVATRFLDSTKDDPPPNFTAHSSGRRTALAKWLTHPDHPLLARTVVNQIWMRHFGTPLVEAVFDFGRKNPAPQQRELLDWLARDFIAHDWSMKHLHRRIVGSHAYRVSSQVPADSLAFAKDPQNGMVWRRLPQRLDAETIRDSLLRLAGGLDAQCSGPPIPMAQHAASPRRSLYLFHSNNDRNLFLTTFDVATVKDCYRRDQSVLPQQALALSHSRLALEAAKGMANHFRAALRDNPRDDAAFASFASRVLLGRTPRATELSLYQQALQDWRALEIEPRDSFLNADANLIWVLLNHHDFLTVE